MITIIACAVICAMLGVIFNWGYYFPNVGGNLEMSGASKIEVKLISAPVGLILGVILGTGVACVIGAFFSAPLQVTSQVPISSLHRNGNLYFYTEKVGDNRVPAAVQVDEAEVVVTKPPAKAEQLDRVFKDHSANQWAIPTGSSHYRFSIPDDNPDFTP